MKRLITSLFVYLMVCPQLILAESLDKNNVRPQNVTGIRVTYKKTIQFVYDNKTYTVYATDCKEMITQPSDSTYIILSPGEPIELKDENRNILILYSLPCD